MSGKVRRAWVNVTVAAEDLDQLEDLIRTAHVGDVAAVRVGWPRTGAHRAQLRLTGDPERVTEAMRAIADTEIVKAAVVEAGQRGPG